MTDDSPRTVADLKKIAEGAEAEIFAWDNGNVLRLFRSGRDDASLAHEEAAMRAARAALPLVPSVVGRVDVDGRPGLVMERVDGPDLITLLSKKPWITWRAGAISGDVHAQLHDVVAPASLPSLVEQAREWVASPLVPEHARRAALHELESLPEGDRLLHCDFHPGNILMSARGPVVIDWPNTTRGAPHADVARTLVLVRGGTLPPGSPLVARAGAALARKIIEPAYLRAYRRRHRLDPDLMRRWTIVNLAIRFAEDFAGERESLLRKLAALGVTA